MKNNTLIILISLLFSYCLTAQVAIGTETPAAGTMLHIEDATGSSGVLFPKVSVPDVSNVAPLPLGTENGTIVYNINTTTGEGYYFFKDGRWEPIFGSVGGMAKFTNVVFSTGSDDLNDGGSNAQIFGSTYFNDNATVYFLPSTAPDADEMVVREAGRYKIVINLSLEGYSGNGNQSLLAVEARLRVNGVIEGGIYRSNEMIAPSNTIPDYSSITITEIVNLNANDVLSVRVSRTQDNGDVYLREESRSSFYIERLD